MGRPLKDLQFNPHEEFSGEYTTARGRLAAFLTDLDPLFRRLMTGEGLHSFDNVAFGDFDAKRRRQFRRAEEHYFALLAAASREGPKNPADVNAEFLDNARREVVSYDIGTKTPGAPRKELDDQAAVRLAQTARKLYPRFRPGVRLVQSARRRGGYRSGVTELRELLRGHSICYLDDEIEAILKGRTVRAAIVRYLVTSLNRKRHARKPATVQTVQATISRGLRQLERASADRFGHR